MSTSRDTDKFVVRLPEGMRNRLADAALARHVSMNTLAVQALESYLDGHTELQIILGALREQLERQGKLPSST